MAILVVEIEYALIDLGLRQHWRGILCETCPFDICLLDHCSLSSVSAGILADTSVRESLVGARRGANALSTPGRPTDPG